MSVFAQQKEKGQKMKVEIAPPVMAQLIDALKNPIFATGIAAIVMIVVVGWVVTTYIKARKV